MDRQLSPRKLWPVCVFGAFLLAFHLYLIWREPESGGINPTALGLALLIILPWLPQIISSTKMGGVEFTFRQLEDRVESQEAEISELKFLIAYYMTKYERRILEKLASDAPFEIDVEHFPEEFEAELRRLRSLGLIDNYEGNGIRSLYRHDPTSTKRDVRRFFFITDAGRSYLAMREKATRPS